jgi:predicted PurR-regulated permease PerM
MPDATTDSFHRRTLFVIGITALVGVMIMILWYGSSVLLLAFAGVLLGILLHALAGWVRDRTRLGRGWSLAIVVTLLTLVLVGVLVLAGATLGSQAQELVRQLPEAYDKFRQKAAEWPLVGAWLSGDSSPAQGPTTAPSSQPAEQLEQTIKDAAPKVATTLGTMVGSLASGVVSFVTVTIVGIYVAATPMLYAAGLVRLVPRRHRGRAREVVAAAVYTLRYWMIAQGITMAVIGILTAAGLYFIGVKLWLLFGLLAALFNFIPNFGPLISFIPAILVAGADSPDKVWWVVGLYVVAQTIEGYVLTPLLQRKAADTPPAILIVVQVLMGILAGAMGIMLAAPVAALGVVLVKMLYVGDALEDRADPPEEHAEIRRMVKRLEAAAVS